MTAVLLAVLLLLLALGVPVAFAVGFGGLTALLLDGSFPLEVAAQRAFAALDSWALMAVPLFILAGELMLVSGMAKRMLALVGRAPAALPVVSIASSMGFAAVSGSSSASTAAVGSVMIPAMRRRGYPIGFAAAFQAAGGALGPIIPPSIILIVVGHLTGASIAALFFGGVVPGLLVGGALMLTGYRQARAWERRAGRTPTETGAGSGPMAEPVSEVTVPASEPAAPTTEAAAPTTEAAAPDDRSGLREFAAAIPMLLMPVLALGGILVGAFTATEAAGVAVAYLVLVGFLGGTLSLSSLRRALLDSALRSAVVLFVATTAALFAWILAVEQVAVAVGAALGAVATPLLFLLAANVLFIVAGMLMESISALIVAVPILFPLALSLGVDPVHFGVLVSVNLCIGMVTPPYGATLFVACSLSGVGVREVAPWTLRPVAFMLVAQLVITVFPPVVLALPAALGLS